MLDFVKWRENFILSTVIVLSVYAIFTITFEPVSIFMVIGNILFAMVLCGFIDWRFKV